MIDQQTTQQQPKPATQGVIVNTLLKAKNSGRAQTTLKAFASTIRVIDRNTELLQPEQVKAFIANLQRDNATKQKYVTFYNLFCELNGINWVKPRYRTERKIPLVPSTENIDKIISAATKKYATIFTILKETGMEAFELATLTMSQIDQAQGIINPQGCKAHNSRSMKLKTATAEMLRNYLATYPGERPFPNSKAMGKEWQRTRKKAARNLNQPNLLRIPMRNLRHHFATALYDKTKDILLVKHLLGHKKLETTMFYTTLISFAEDEEYTVKTAKDVKEYVDLVEHGFTLVGDMDGIKIFKKRK